MDALSNVEIMPLIQALLATLAISPLRPGAIWANSPSCAPSAPRFPNPQRPKVAMSRARLLIAAYVGSV
jgi:hypothetical protein